MLLRGELEFQSILCYLKESPLARYFSQEIQNDALTVDQNLYDGRKREDYLILDQVKSPEIVKIKGEMMRDLVRNYYNHNDSTKKAYEQKR